MRKDLEARIVSEPHFNLPRKSRVRFNGKYFKRRLREIRKTLPRGRTS